MILIFFLLFIICGIALILGLIKPSLVLRWLSGEEQNRKNVLKYFGVGLLASMIMMVVITPGSDGSIDKDGKDNVVIEPLFEDIYYELTQKVKVNNKEELLDFIDKKKGYELIYDDKTGNYKIIDNNSNDDNYVYISLDYESTIDGISYYDSIKNLEVGTYNYTNEKKKEDDILKVHIIGKPSEKVGSIEEQIEFLKTTVNENYDKRKEESPEEPIDLELELKYQIEDGRLRPIVETNLPEGTSGILTLSSEELDYIGQAKFNISKGKSDTEFFSNQGEALEAGSYKLEVTFPIASTQENDVLIKIGENYSNYKGDKIKENELGNIIEDEIELLIEGTN